MRAHRLRLIARTFPAGRETPPASAGATRRAPPARTAGPGAPAHGLWGDLTLQSCVGPDTGFTYLMRT
ncbi:hypothetical protein OH809_16665 [Streptomyces sp. NBC_00873]|uniref:hypothetical protein n=1 Tax=unclassified Streptomyces TaxID=2593676 RepID=UPI00386DE636|nr:hypothetical protein OH809_16665 [Streptomyces sp. NBC_00873]WTA45822.1 hypothetical protein OH821_27020 [Streptomyces sp. NBC_00842]